MSWSEIRDMFTRPSTLRGAIGIVALSMELGIVLLTTFILDHFKPGPELPEALIGPGLILMAAFAVTGVFAIAYWLLEKLEPSVHPVPEY